MSATTPNKSINVPAHGSFSNDWDVPVNASWNIIDQAFGGVTAISVTGVLTDQVLSLAQYTPPNIEITGTLSAELAYFVPANVGGIWSVYNNTNGAFPLVFGYETSYTIIPVNERAFFVGDGTTMSLASTYVPNVEESAVLAWQAAIAIQGTQIQSVVPVGVIPGLPGSQITSGTVAAARLPLAGTLPGITIQADPGTTPSGTYGDVFYFY
jgi:hypothetical protein